MVPSSIHLDTQKEGLLSFDRLAALNSLCYRVVECGIEGSFEHCVLNQR